MRYLIGLACAMVLVACGQEVTSDNDSRNGPDETPTTETVAIVTEWEFTNDGGILVTPEDLGFPADSNDPVDPPVDIVIWVDMNCPACASFSELNADFLKDAVATGQITLEYRFANFLNRNSPDEYSTRSAAALACTYGVDGPETFLDLQQHFYANQPGGQAGPSDDEIAGAAAQLGASDMSAACIRQGEFIDWANDSGDAFNTSGYSFTPSVIVAGELLETSDGSMIEPEDLEDAIADARS